MDSKKIKKLMDFVDEVQRSAREDYALTTQLRSSLFFIDKALEQKQKDLETSYDKLKEFFDAMVASELDDICEIYSVTGKSSETVEFDRPRA